MFSRRAISEIKTGPCPNSLARTWRALRAYLVLLDNITYWSTYLSGDPHVKQKKRRDFALPRPKPAAAFHAGGRARPSTKSPPPKRNLLLPLARPHLPNPRV